MKAVPLPPKVNDKTGAHPLIPFIPFIPLNPFNSIPARRMRRTLWPRRPHLVQSLQRTPDERLSREGEARRRPVIWARRLESGGAVWCGQGTPDEELCGEERGRGEPQKQQRRRRIDLTREANLVRCNASCQPTLTLGGQAASMGNEER